MTLSKTEILTILVSIIGTLLIIWLVSGLITACSIQEVRIPIQVKLDTRKYEILKEKRLPAIMLENGDSLPIKQVLYRIR